MRRPSLRQIALALAVLELAAAAGPAASSSRSVYTRGVDVSHWRGRIAWPRVAAAGYRFAYAEATNGARTDPLYARFRRDAPAAGLAFGAFHLARPSGATPDAVAADAVAEARHFLAVARPRTGELVPVLDLEHTGGLRPAALGAWTSAWLAEVQAELGMRAVIYASPAFWRAAMANSAAFAVSGSPLWIAHWTHARSPAVPARNWGALGWTFWQWTDCLRVPGIAGCADGDRFGGPDLTRALIPPPPVAATPPAIAGTASVGQTLTASPGTWTAPAPPTVTYRWQRCDATGGACAPIAGASGPGYTVSAADAGHTLVVVVTATSARRSAAAQSAPTAVVA